MPAITISSSYGAGGSVIAPRIASALKFTMVDRAIPVAVAESLAVPLDEALAHDEQVDSWVNAFLHHAALGFGGFGPIELPDELLTEQTFKNQTERVILAGRSDVFHVRLDGPPEARVQQAVALQDVSEVEARRRLRETDRARSAYVRHFYQRQWDDPRLYHLTIDSTAIPLATCEQLILSAARARLRLAAPERT